MTAPPSVAPEIIRAALLTYDLEQAMNATGLQRDALAAALGAGIRAAERQVLARVIRWAETYASEIAASDGEDDSYSVAIRWFAAQVSKDVELDPSGPYTPVAGDVVEVTVVGQVSTWHDMCAHCGKENDRHNSWSITDDQTGQEFTFPARQASKAPKVRVLSRASENETQEEK
jgi:hypothetical protein